MPDPTSSPTRGLFVSFEGPECAGKSTQIKLLAATLRARGLAVVETREPGGTALGERLREVLLFAPGDHPLCAEAELLLFAASRAQLLAQVIVPHLQAGGVVLCDRFADSTIAYQGYGRGYPLDKLDKVLAVATGGRWPDLTFLLDLDWAEMSVRRVARGGAPDRFEAEAQAFHARVRAGYLAQAAAQPARWRVLPGTLPVATLEHQIAEAVLDALARLR